MTHTHDPDALIAALAVRQYGVVSREQLLSAGLSPSLIHRRIKRGRLRRLHTAVYLAGPVGGLHEREMAALLACGAGAVLSHGTAGALWRLLSGQQTEIEVTIRSGYPRLGPEVRLHRARALPADEVGEVAGLAVTTPARTLLDLAVTLSGTDLERCLARADRQGLVSRRELGRLLVHHAGRPGCRALRQLLSQERDAALTRSEAEARFLSLVRVAQLPAPRANARVRGYEVDMLWQAERLVVEIDGFAFHSSARSFDRDRRRDSVLTAAGFRVMRVTWTHLVREPEALLARVAQALVQGGSR